VNHNAPDLWDRIWREEGEESWRGRALAEVYTRVCQLVPESSRVVDVGGGIGLLARRLQDEKKCECTVIDHSKEACELACRAGVSAVLSPFSRDYIEALQIWSHEEAVLVATEFCEHLVNDDRKLLFEYAEAFGSALFSVPNNRLGPDEEPQHHVKYTALSFLTELRAHFGADCRVEVLGPYLLGVCGRLAHKEFKLSACTPARDEAADLEATLASLRGVADEIIVGVDPRTVDGTREVAARYAEIVFELESPEGPPNDQAPNGGVHFAWIRNQCMDRCTGDWIFMTEAHERLVAGHDTLLALDKLMPRGAKLGMVVRTGNGQAWAFPWLTKNEPSIRYKRMTHNVVDYPEGTLGVRMPQVRTLHERHRDRELARRKQRGVQNRLTLLDDWLVNDNEVSLHYLGAEWREHNPQKAIERFEEFLALPARNGPMRYHTRLLLAKSYARAGRRQDAKKVLLSAAADDWSRTEHWLWLGDLSYEDGDFEQALQFYRYCATTVGEPPFGAWWIDEASYTYLPAQRLAMTYGELSRHEDALYWARRVRELLPNNAPPEALAEVDANVRLLEEAAA
jgi:tetratricopeptide (TPR) repeat protein